MQKTKTNQILEYDIPEWAICYLDYGYDEGLSDDEKAVADKWVSENFPNGYTFSPDFEDYNELDFYPAFGTRNKNALTKYGESPYLGVKTIKCKFVKF